MANTENTPLLRAGQPSNAAQGLTGEPSQGLRDFLNQLGIDINTGKPLRNSEGIYQKFQSEYHWRQPKYIIGYGVAYTLLFFQLAIGITISILTALKPPHVSTIVIILGGVNSLIAGLAGIMQYTGEPMRSWRAFATLDKLKIDLEKTWGNFRVPSYDGNGLQVGQRLSGLFEQAITDALANEPQVWASGNRTVGEALALGDRDDREHDRSDGREAGRGGRREGV